MFEVQSGRSRITKIISSILKPLSASQTLEDSKHHLFMIILDALFKN